MHNSDVFFAMVVANVKTYRKYESLLLKFHNTKEITSFRSIAGLDKSEHACRIAVIERVNND